MSSKLQLTTLAVLVSAALPAQAALYKVVEVTPGVSGAEYYGTAIQPGMTTDPKGCFTDDCGDGAAYKLAGETRNRAEGFSYREEVPFAMDNSFGYIEDDYDGFEDYCNYQLGYATCEYWASDRWDSWNYETYKYSNPHNPNIPSTPDTPNSLAFIEGVAENSTNSINTVINSFSKASGAASTLPIGNYSTSSKRNEVFSDVVNADILTKSQSRAWASDGTYVVGSTSTKSGVGDNRYYYSSSPAVWNTSNLISIARAGGSDKDGDYYSQGSMRDFYIGTTAFYGVGYNNYNDQHMNATIFIASSTDPITATWSQKQISGAEVDAGDDNTNTNSVATNINKNLVVVGQAKRSGNNPQNGAAANRLFIVPDASVSSNASFFSGGIFFDGAGGEMGGINNFNEIVGRIDSENFREYDGKQRRQRAFIYPYGITGKISDKIIEDAINTRKTILGGKAQLIDNLTNGGAESSNNNQYRIYNASDINDAGVISATAVKCFDESGSTAREYDSTAHNAYCGDGDGTEKIVAVKLVPIAGEVYNAGDDRIYESTATERQGAGFGFGALTLLSLFGFMRKRIK